MEIIRCGFIIGEVGNEIIKDNNQMVSGRSAFWIFFVSSNNSYHIRIPFYQWTFRGHKSCYRDFASIFCFNATMGSRFYGIKRYYRSFLGKNQAG